MVRDDARRARLRLLQVAAAKRGPFDPPLLSLSPRNLRQIDAMDEASVTPLSGVREELWVCSDEARLRARIDDAGKLEVLVEREGATPVTKHLIRIPLGREATEGAARYFARWEHGKDRAVISPRGAGVILHPDSLTIDREPELVDVYEGEGVLLAFRNVPNGARVVCADGVDGLERGDLVSDVRVPDVARGPSVSIHPREAFLRGFPSAGFEASFGGIDFEGFVPTQGEGSAELARFTKKQRGIAYGAVRSVEKSGDEDALLAHALTTELSPSADTGRIKKGKPGTITLTDGRRYRVQAGVRERLPKGTFELVSVVLLDGVILARVCVPVGEMTEPSANEVLATLKSFLLGLRAIT